MAAIDLFIEPVSLSAIYSIQHYSDLLLRPALSSLIRSTDLLSQAHRTSPFTYLVPHLRQQETRGVLRWLHHVPSTLVWNPIILTRQQLRRKRRKVRIQAIMSVLITRKRNGKKTIRTGGRYSPFCRS